VYKSLAILLRKNRLWIEPRFYR